MAPSTTLPYLGFGLGLRPRHYPYIFEHWPQLDWVEVISENFMDTDGKPRRNLARIREHYPVVMHGVALSIGTVDPLNSEYLRMLKSLIDWLDPAWVSDHLCWTGVAHRTTHDLLPVPYTEEALRHITQRIRHVQDFLERPVAFENPSTYLEFKSSHMPEAEFIARMAEASGCHLLLDVNNVYVTCYNHRLDAKQYLDTLPLDKVIQIHLSGHSNHGTHIIDTHDGHVTDPVWALYQYAVQRAGRTPNTMIEWDDHIPEFPVLFAELEKAKAAATWIHDYGSLPDLVAPQMTDTTPASSSLADEQVRMQNAIVLHTDTSPEAWILSKHGFSPQAQLDVYIDAYRLRLYEVLREDYPVLAYYLGADDFEAVMRDFIHTVASDHFNIARYSTRLPGFLAKARPHDIPAQEICVLEATLCQLADAMETPALSASDLYGLTPEALMHSFLHPRAALQLMECSYQVNAYYHDVMEGQRPSAPVLETHWLAVFRHDDTLWRMELSHQEFRILHLLFTGMRIDQALTILQEEFHLDEAVLTSSVSDWFARWMRHHLLTRIDPPLAGAFHDVA